MYRQSHRRGYIILLLGRKWPAQQKLTRVRIIERLAKTEATGLLPEGFVFALCTKRESVVEREALCAAEMLLSKALSPACLEISHKTTGSFEKVCSACAVQQIIYIKKRDWRFF